MIKPDKKTFVELSKKGNVVPVYCDILADMHTPVGAFQKISKGSKYAFLLESVEGGEKWGRYTFVGASPSLVIRTSGAEGTRITPKKREKFKLSSDPLEVIKKEMSAYKPVAVEGLPPFNGGFVGSISYDCVRFFEKLPDKAKKDQDFPDAVFMLADSMVVFDNVRQTIKILVNAHVDKAPGKVYDEAVAKIKKLLELLEKTEKAPKKTGSGKLAKPSSNTKEADYYKSVERCKHYIKEGDIFQVVLAQRLSIKLGVPAFEVYRALRYVNPSPYMYFLKLDDWEVVGASPEILSRVQNGRVVLRPLAGTRRRGKDEAEDKQLERELLNDHKELAEHIMLVDLGRNDVGRVSKPGTVKVTGLKMVEKYSHVMHIVSNVEGELADGKDCFDVIRASFPAGTLSGAPKIRAMEIIDELEPTRRGLYGGTVGYFGYNGNMDHAIAIRTLAVKNGVAQLGVGAGIVADSDPASEQMECMNKGRALLRAIELATAKDKTL
ncbi:MAG: anthranilate synthase component I [Nitrospinae bacterium]|nr:anthranilate synthase component I [Nitrospinota bacterium]